MMTSERLSGSDCSVSFRLLVLPRDSSAPRRNAVGSLVLVEREGEREGPREGGREGNWSVAAAAKEEERATGGGRQS